MKEHHKVENGKKVSTDYYCCSKQFIMLVFGYGEITRNRLESFLQRLHLLFADTSVLHGIWSLVHR